MTLDKGTLIRRKESIKHFVHPDQRWNAVAISLDFTGNKVTGISTNANGQDKPIAVDLTGPIFGDATGSMVTIGCLQLADGYSTTVRDLDITRLKEVLWQLKVTGAERVTVPAGTFDSYRVELTANDGTGDRNCLDRQGVAHAGEGRCSSQTLRNRSHGNGSVKQRITTLDDTRTKQPTIYF